MLKPYMMSGIVEAGCDEAGRGPLAGSVFAAAVILPPDFTNEVLNEGSLSVEIAVADSEEEFVKMVLQYQVEG